MRLRLTLDLIKEAHNTTQLHTIIYLSLLGRNHVFFMQVTQESANLTKTQVSSMLMTIICEMNLICR